MGVDSKVTEDGNPKIDMAREASIMIPDGPTIGATPKAMEPRPDKPAIFFDFLSVVF